MRRIFTIALVLLANFIIQASLFQYIEINMIKPNTGLIIVICYAILRGDVEGSILGFCQGLMQDMFFGKFIGLHALLGLLTGYFCGKPFKDFYSENYLLPVALTGASTLLYEIAFYFANYFFRAKLDFLFYFYRIIFPSAIYSVVLSAPIYIMLYSINKKLEVSERTSKSIF